MAVEVIETDLEAWRKGLQLKGGCTTFLRFPSLRPASVSNTLRAGFVPAGCTRSSRIIHHARLTGPHVQHLADEDAYVLSANCALDAGPFRRWEAEMGRLLDAGDDDALERYGVKRRTTQIRIACRT